MIEFVQQIKDYINGGNTMIDREEIKTALNGKSDREYDKLIMIARLVLQGEESQSRGRNPHQEEKRGAQAR